MYVSVFEYYTREVPGSIGVRFLILILIYANLHAKRFYLCVNVYIFNFVHFYYVKSVVY